MHQPQNVLLPLLQIDCLDIHEAKLNQPEIDRMKGNLTTIADYFRKITQEKTDDVYYLQISRQFSRDHRDLLHLIRNIELELRSPREKEMAAFSFAALWLYREQITLLRELGCAYGNAGRSHPPN